MGFAVGDVSQVFSLGFVPVHLKGSSAERFGEQCQELSQTSPLVMQASNSESHHITVDRVTMKH